MRVVVIALVVGVGCGRPGGLEGASDASETRYLTFQYFTSGGDFQQVDFHFPDGGEQVATDPPPTPPPTHDDMDQWVGSLVDAIGATGDERNHLAFAIGPVTFDMTDAQVEQLILDAFEIGLARDVAVAVHIDDFMFWLGRKDLWSDAQNVEWSDWAGTPNTGAYLNWGQPAQLAPQMCFNSAAIQSLVKARAQVVGRAIAAGRALLRVAGKDHLFAGVIQGWETHIGVDFTTQKQLGYCALTNRGYSQSNPPAHPDFERDQAVKDFLGLWATSLNQAGVEKQRIYTHLPLLTPTTYDTYASTFPNPLPYDELLGFCPPWIAISDDYRPGFSIYGDASYLAGFFQQQGAGPWAQSEGAIPPNSSAEAFLAQVFNHGGVLQNLFGWGLTHDTVTTGDRTPEAISAYQKFLAGEALQDGAL